MMRFSIFFLLMAVLSLFCSAADQPLAEAARKTALKLEAGCVVTGERIGETVKFAVTGNLEPKEAAPERVLFEMGSITKVFTGLLLAQAVVEGKVTLETTVGGVLGTQATFEDPRIGEITLKQLSTHTSGLPRLPDNMGLGSDPNDPYAHYDESLLLAYLKTAKLDERKTFLASYSNLGAGLLGYLLGRVYETSWEKLVMQKVCVPLGLKDTAVDVAASTLPVAPPYDGKKAMHPWHLNALAGAGALCTTAADLMKFGEALMKPESTPLKEALSLAMTVQAEAASLGGQIGLGILIEKKGGDVVCHHDGGTGGFRSTLQVIPSRQIVRVVLTNNAAVNPAAVLTVAAPMPVPIKPEKLTEITLPVEALKRFVGVYEVDQTTAFTVLLHEDHLWIKLTGQAFLQSYASSANRFFYKQVAAAVEFNEKEGRVESLTLFQNGRELKAIRSPVAGPAITLRSAKDLRPYTGKYAIMGMKEMVVTVRGSALFAQLEGQPAMPVFETSPDRFDYDVVKATLAFSRDKEGAVNGLTLLQNGMTLPAARK